MAAACLPPNLTPVESEHMAAIVEVFPQLRNPERPMSGCCITAALRAMGQVPPDLIVLDLGLPDVEGTEVCRRVRRHHVVHGSNGHLGQ